MKGYRYLDLHWGLWSLRNGLFKLNKPSDFNDPYDCYGISKNNIPLEVYRDYRRRLPIREMAVKFGRDADELKELSDAELERVGYTNFGTHFDTVAMSRTTLDKNWGILCMTDAKNEDPHADTLFWSLYADHAKGMRILLDTQTLDESKQTITHKVLYTDDVPVCDLSLLDTYPNSDLLRRFICRCVWTKGKAWEREKEVRLVASRQTSTNVLQIGTMECPDNLYLKVTPDMVRSIEFAPRADQKEISACLEMLRKKYPSATIRQAAMLRERYEIVTEEIFPAG